MTAGAAGATGQEGAQGVPGTMGPQGPQGLTGSAGVVAGINVIHHISAHQKTDQHKSSTLSGDAGNDGDIDRRLQSLTTKMDALKRLLERQVHRNA